MGMKRVSVLAAVAMTVVVVAGCSGSKSKSDTPDGAIRSMQASVLDNRPGQVFKAMPASYQADIDSLVADAAKRMDTELWNESTALLKQAVGILESKRKLLLASPMMASVPIKADVEKNWDSGISLLQALVNSEFSSIERLREGKVEGLLTGNGAAIMAKITDLMANSESSAEAGKELAKLKDMRVSLVSQDGDSAIVKIEAPEETPENIDMVKVEGVWLPKEMVSGFSLSIAEARKKLEQIDFTSEEGKQKKTMILMQIGAIKPLLTQLEAAKTQEDVQAVFGGLMMGLMGGMNQGNK
jgi:hypothetical protein